MKKNPNLVKNNETSISSIINTNNISVTSIDTEDNPDLHNNNYSSDTSSKKQKAVCVNVEVDNLGDLISGPCQPILKVMF
jgi:hypothetical protein